MQGVPETAAENYLEHLLANEWQEGGLEKALFQGNLLLEAAGGVSEAALVLRAVGRDKLGNHFAELGDPRLDEALDADLLSYARTVAEGRPSLLSRGPKRASDRRAPCFSKGAPPRSHGSAVEGCPQGTRDPMR